MVYVIHLEETDGDIHFERCFTFTEALEYIERNNLLDEDCTIIHGTEHAIKHLRSNK